MMSLSSRLVELTEKHRSLDKKIADEVTRPAADPAKLARLKHEKLKIKDEMTKLEVQTQH